VRSCCPQSHKTRAAILAQLDEEYALGLPFTRSGPQTHDVKIKINNHDAKTTASRGENRTIIFAMLYSMIELANEELDSNIYLLFDDIDSELDSTHQKNLYLNNIFNNNYLFATTIATKHRAANRLRFD
jgi:recombinational DNA repair ATPase RecF